MHGEFIWTDRGRFEVPVYPRKPPMVYHWTDPVPYPEQSYSRVTYTVEIYREVQGNCLREMRIAVIDGAKNITTRDHWEIEDDMRQMHWVPWQEPSFLKDFESWFAWCAYRNDNFNSKHLQEEFFRRLTSPR